MTDNQTPNDHYDDDDNDDEYYPVDTITLDYATVETLCVWLAVVLSEYDERNKLELENDHLTEEERQALLSEQQIPDRDICKFAVSGVYAANALSTVTLSHCVYNQAGIQLILFNLSRDNDNPLTTMGYLAIRDLYHRLTHPIAVKSDVIHFPEYTAVLVHPQPKGGSN